MYNNLNNYSAVCSYLIYLIEYIYSLIIKYNIITRL